MANKPTNPFKRYCCVNGCITKRKNKDYSLSFFKIPNNPERRREWLTAIDREDLLDVKESKRNRNYFICSEHFEESAIITTVSKRITQDAVPVKCLPYKARTDPQPEASGSKQTRPQTSKDLSSNVTKKVNNSMPVSCYSHAQTQTDIQAEEHILLYDTDEDESDEPKIDEKEITRDIDETNINVNDIKIEIFEPDIEELLNEWKNKPAIPYETLPSTSSISMQADLNETSDKEGD